MSMNLKMCEFEKCEELTSNSKRYLCEHHGKAWLLYGEIKGLWDPDNWKNFTKEQLQIDRVKNSIEVWK